MVTDPQKADAVLTDRIGTGFEQKLNELYEPPEAKKSDRSFIAGEFSVRSCSRLLAVKALFSWWTEKTRNVLWSTYAVAKSTAPDDMNHLADKIVARSGKTEG